MDNLVFSAIVFEIGPWRDRKQGLGQIVVSACVFKLIYFFVENKAMACRTTEWQIRPASSI
jgi:hypothetical protein